MDKKKKMLSKLIGDDVRDVQIFSTPTNPQCSHGRRLRKKQDILDSLLRASYPFISEGRGLTSALAPIGFSYEIMLQADLLPEGEEDYTIAL